ncbi:MAG TPA: PKD domain-containing protein, partial [Bacteroidia bacterium]|nr:PKD domain-containing protein [Bacteroidia bacterium]
GELTGSAILSSTGGTGNYTWTWNGNISSSSSITNVGAGNYTATITDQSGCSTTVPVSINQPSTPLTIQGTVTQTSCGNNDGSVVLNTSGGTSPYSYVWNNGSVTSSLNSLFAGIYTVTVTDQNNCSETNSFTVQASNAPVVSVTSTVDVSCSGGNDGSAVLTVNGGLSPYTWNWQNGASTGSTASNLVAGTYNVTVSDAGGCQSFVQVVINQPDPLAIQMSQPVTICIGSNTFISGTVSGGSQPYTYLWNNNSTTSQVNVNPVVTTSYILTVTDSKGCSQVSAPIAVTVFQPLSLTANFPDSVCKNSNALISLQANGGDGNYSFNWSNGLVGISNSITITNDTSLTIVLSDGCTTPSVQTSLSITAVNAPDLNFSLEPQKGCAPFTAQFDVPPGTPAGFIYNWNFGDGFSSSQASVSHTYLHDGMYAVSLTVAYPSASECSTLINFPAAVTVYPVPVARFIYDPPVPTLNHPDVYFTDRSINANAWNWNFGDHSGEVREPNPMHTYKDTGNYVVRLSVVSNDGCRDSAYEFIHVTEEMQVFIPNAFTPNGSGVNDNFQVYGVGFTSYEISLYDRWGKLVHYAKNSDQAWDGTDDSSRQPVPQGVYVYKITITDNSGNMHNRFDHVTLIR